jgi:hypothetical protein
LALLSRGGALKPVALDQERFQMDRSCLLGFLVLELGCSPCSTPNSPSLFSSWTSVASKDRPRGVAVSSNPYKKLWEAIPPTKTPTKGGGGGGN